MSNHNTMTLTVKDTWMMPGRPSVCFVECVQDNPLRNLFTGDWLHSETFSTKLMGYEVCDLPTETETLILPADCYLLLQPGVTLVRP